MPRLDARAIARVARNPACRLAPAVELCGLSDEDAFRLLTGRPYPGERGERAAALRWGARFEAALTENGARRLLASLAAIPEVRPAGATVLDLRAVVPGKGYEATAARNRVVRAVLADLLAGRGVPDLLLQPPLELLDGRSCGFVVPDGLLFHPVVGAYVPVEVKANVSLDGEVPAADRERARLQAAVQLRALRAEVRRLGFAGTVAAWAVFVFASPLGFRPAPAVQEQLLAEVSAVEAALQTVARTSETLCRGPGDRSFPQLLRELPIHFRESCLAACPLAEACRTRAPGVRGALGDAASRILGDADPARVASLFSGEPPATPAEADLLAEIGAAARLYGWA